MARYNWHPAKYYDTPGAVLATDAPDGAHITFFLDFIDDDVQASFLVRHPGDGGPGSLARAGALPASLGVARRDLRRPARPVRASP